MTTEVELRGDPRVLRFGVRLTQVGCARPCNATVTDYHRSPGATHRCDKGHLWRYMQGHWTLLDGAGKAVPR